MTSEELEELKGLAASMGLYDDKKPCKRAVILGKAIKALEQDTVSKESYDHEYFLRRKMETQIDHLNKYISKLETQIVEQEPRWIPVSERYPKPEDEYKMFLVTDDKGVVSIQVFYLSIEKEPQPYFSGMVNVIAWMPLQKPYKAESEEKE